MRTSSPSPCPRQSASFTLPIVALGVAAYLLARTFVYPGVPVLLVGDQGFFWTYADDLLQGQLPYRDFFQFTPPGTDLAFAGAFALFGKRIWVPNAVVVALGTALGAVCFRVGRTLMSDLEAALATALFTVLVYGQALSATHHAWSVLGIMAAVSVLIPSFTPRRFAAAGALLGGSALFTQSHAPIALVAIVAFALWHARREALTRRTTLLRVGTLVGGFAAVTVPAAAYLIARVGADPLWDSLVVYVWRYLRQPLAAWTFGLPEALTTTSVRWLGPYLAVYAMVPLAYGLTFVLSRDEMRGRGVPAPRALCWLVGVALLLEVLPGLSWVRLYAVTLPAVLLFVWALGRSARFARAFASVATVGIVMLACAFVRSTYRNHADVLELPGGRVASTAKDREKLSWLADHLRPDEAVFLAHRSSFYLPLAVHDPLYLDAVVPGSQTTPALVREAMRELDAKAVLHVLWAPVLEAPEPGQSAEGVPALTAYVHARYRLERTFADGDELWERKP